jgi:hypothetical protein
MYLSRTTSLTAPARHATSHISSVLKAFVGRRLSGDIDDFNAAKGTCVIQWEQGMLAADPDGTLASPSSSDAPFSVGGGSLWSSRNSNISVHGNQTSPYGFTLNCYFPKNFVRPFDASTIVRAVPDVDAKQIAQSVLASLADFNRTHNRWIEATAVEEMVHSWNVIRAATGTPLLTPITLDARVRTVEFEVVPYPGGRGVMVDYVTAEGGAPLDWIPVPEVDSIEALTRYYKEAARLRVMHRSAVLRRNRRSKKEGLGSSDTTDTAASHRRDVHACMFDMGAAFEPHEIN